MKNKKIQPIIFILILSLISFGIIQYVRGLINVPPDIKIPKEFMLGDTKIALAWTDDNTGEDLIIQSDKKIYLGLNRIEVYFSITNATKSDQDMDAIFWTESEEVKVEGVEKLEKNKNPKLQILNSKQIQNSNLKAQNRKDVNGYTTGHQTTDTIKSGQTNYYQAILSYPEDSRGEFFIESFGSQGGYGHLDPYYASGLVGYWSFDGADINWGTNTAYDRSGQGNNGAITNMSTSTSPTAGISGQALEFDGVDDYADMGNASGLKSPLPLSISMWVYRKGTAIFPLFRTDDTGDYYGYWAYINGAGANSNKIDLTFGDGTGQSSTDRQTKRSASTVTPNTWVHVTGVIRGASDMDIYINAEDAGGAYEGTGGDINYSSNPARIGRWGSYYSNGSIDEVRIYNRALSPSEISQLYSLGTRKLQVNTSLVNTYTDGLVGHWTFNGPDINWGTNTAYDRSGQGNNGAITNMSTSTSPVIGMSGQALEFDGDGDYINLANKQDFELGDAWTISSWFDWKALGIDGTYSAFIGDKSAQDGIYLRWWTGNFVFRNSGGIAYEFGSSSGYYQTGWHHISLVANGNGSTSLYLDGMHSQTLDATTTFEVDTIGRAYNTGDRDFNGLLDEIRIYNRALSADEVGALYRAESRRYITR